MPIEIANLTLNIGQQTSVSWTDISSAITSIILVITTILTLFIYIRVWFYDVLLKEEYRVLLEFKNAYTATQNSIHWFLFELLNKEHRYAFHVERTPIIKRVDVIENYNKLVKLNNFYNDYQYVFRKYKIEKDIELLTTFLDIVRFLPENDISLVLTSQIFQRDGDIETYVLPQIGQICGIFITSAYNILHPVVFPQKFSDYFIFSKTKKNKVFQKRCDENIKKLSELGTDENFAKIKNEVSQKLNLLSFKLDHLCMSPVLKIPKNLKIRQKSFYPILKTQEENNAK